MKEQTNYSKLEKIFIKNGGFITREDLEKKNIPSWFLSDFIRKNNLIKIAPGFYVDKNYLFDDYYILQRRYPKYIFSGMSALYIHGLTDKIPNFMDVTAPQGYHPSRKKIDNLSIRAISNTDIYNLGIIEAETMFGNKVKVYDQERVICDLVKYRDKYDGETFVKAIREYLKKVNDQIKLFKYARILGVEKKVFEIIEVMSNGK